MRIQQRVPCRRAVVVGLTSGPVVRTRALAIVVLLGGLAAAPGFGQVVTKKPDALEGVGIDEHLDAQIPLDLTFRDGSGQSLRLAEIFNGQLPVLLSLNYSDCPMLCQVQLNGVVEGLKPLSWSAGTELRVVSVSINPLETPQRAQQTKQRYVKRYGRPGTAGGWHFLTGDPESIRRLADAVGFRYKYVAETKEYVHAATLMVCTPTGRVSRYLHGVLYDPRTLKLSLVEASEGRIGTKLDQLVLYCFHYDETAGRYGPAAVRIMQVGGGTTLAVLLAILLPVWLRGLRRRPEPAAR